MPAVQTTITQYHKRWPGAGFIPDMRPDSANTGLVETAAGIPFGRAVSQGTGDQQVILGGTLAKFRGVSILDQFRVPTVSVPVADFYAFRENIGYRTRGPIVVINASGQAVAAGDKVFYDPVTGLFANTQGAIAVAAPSFAGTGNGVLTRSTPQYAGTPKPGTYNIRFVTAAANGGRFIVVDPEFDQVGEGVVGTEFNSAGAPRFTIADGATDFVVGDTFQLVVSQASEGPIFGARWETSAADAALAMIHLALQN